MPRASTNIDPEIVTSLRELEGTDGGDFFAELVAIFEKQYGEFLPSLESSLEKGDAKPVSRVMHQLRSSSGNLGARQFGELCGEYEDETQGGNLENFRKNFTEFKQTYREVLANLKAIASSR